MATSDDKIEVRIEGELKERAVKAARGKGLTLSDAIRGLVRLWVENDAPDPTAPSRLDLPTTQEIYCVGRALSLAQAVLSGFERKFGGSLYGWESNGPTAEPDARALALLISNLARAGGLPAILALMDTLDDDEADKQEIAQAAQSAEVETAQWREQLDHLSVRQIKRLFALLGRE